MELVSSNKNRRGRAQLIADDGTTLFVDFHRCSNYLPGRHVVILCDVTERTHAEISLRKSEERFQAYGQQHQEIFWMMDATTQEVIYINPAYAAITGTGSESLHVKSVFIPRTDPPRGQNSRFSPDSRRP